MNTSFFITCNRGKLRAFRKTETGSLELVGEKSFREGTSKISEMVTDQAGAFPVSGSPGTSAYESLPLKEELETRSLRKAAAAITAILNENQPGWWALAAPSEIHPALVETLDPKSRDSISIHCHRDLTGIPADRLLGHFSNAAEEPSG